MRLLLRWIITAATLLLATNLITGFEVRNFYIALIAALVLGLLNAVVRPVLIILTLPVNIITLGLFTFVINALLIWFMSSFIKGVVVEGFLPAFFVAIILWAVGTLTNRLLYTGDE
jgi:putative membrane protein